MKIALAQIRPEQGEVENNLAHHQKWVKAAAAECADMVIFPELSLTGYEPTLAHTLAMTPVDCRLDVFQALSDTHQMVIALGLPTQVAAGVQISMVIFQPGRPRQVYSKQMLHIDELFYFVAGHGPMTITVGETKIVPAICYESLQPVHAAQAIKQGASIYLASVAKAQKGIDKAMAYYPTLARRYGVKVCMVNAVGPCDNFTCVGQSAVWDEQGRLCQQLDSHTEGLLVVDIEALNPAEVVKGAADNMP